MKQDVFHYFPKGQKLVAEVTGIPNTIVVVHKFPDPLVVKTEEEKKPALKGGLFMYIVKDVQVDVSYEVAFEVTDAEGHKIPDAKLVVEVVTDNEDAVSLIADATDPKKGVAHFGAPGLANINCTVKTLDGVILGSFGAQFTVTVGDPAAISGGTLKFGDLTEVPEPPIP